MPYKDPEKRKQSKREWYEQHKDQVIARSRFWKKESPETSRERSRRNRAKNPEKWREKDRLSYAKDPEKQREERRRWYANNTDKARESAREYKRQHPDIVRQHNLKHRARKVNAECSLSPEEEAAILATGCFFCGSHEDLTIAHDKPISKGGSTNRANVFCACRKCNSKMYTRSLVQVIKQLLLGF